MTKRIAFTPAGIGALKSGKLADPLTPGLTIEALPSGKRVWKYRRRIAGGAVLNERLGLYPLHSIADARAWAATLNDSVLAGIDPKAEREAAQAAQEAAEAALRLTVDYCHARYMEAVHLNDHRTRKGEDVRPLSKRTIGDKLRLYNHNVKDVIGSKLIADVTEDDLDSIIHTMNDRDARIQANRLGAEMQVFWGWVRSRRGEKALGIKIPVNPAERLGELWNAQEGRDRWLDPVELPIFFKALAAEPEPLYRRAFLLLLITACRRSELFEAKASWVRLGMFIIPKSHAKNGREHPIILAPWTASLIAATCSSDWLMPSPRDVTKAMHPDTLKKVVVRIRKRMKEISGVEAEHFTLHDLRRTFRSSIRRYGVDEDIRERMMNHAITGMKKIYDRDTCANEMASGFLAWDQALARIAIEAGVGEALGVVLTKAAEPEAMPQPLHA